MIYYNLFGESTVEIRSLADEWTYNYNLRKYGF
jgi:hypothetical protein